MDVRQRVALVLGICLVGLGAGFPLIKPAADRARFVDRNRRCAALLAAPGSDQQRGMLPYLSPDAETVWNGWVRTAGERRPVQVPAVRLIRLDRKAGVAVCAWRDGVEVTWRRAGREWLLDTEGMRSALKALGPAVGP